MSDYKKTKRNLIYQTLYQFLILGIPLILSPYLTRTLGSEGLGTYSYCYSIAGYFSIFIMMGLQVHGCRAIAACQNKEEQRKVFYSLMVFHLVCSAVVLVLYLIFVLLFSKEYTTIYLILLFYLLSCILDTTWLFYGIEDFKSVVLKNTAVKVLELVLIFVFVKNEKDLLVYVIIMSASLAIGSILLLPYIIRNYKPYLPSFSDIKPHIKPLLFLTISVIAMNVYTLLDKTIIGIMVKDNNSSVAFYDYSEKIAKLPITLLAVLGSVLLPKMSSLFSSNNIEEMKKIVYRSTILLSCVASGACFGIAAIAKLIMPIYYGEEFSICGDYLMYLSPLIIIIPFGSTVRNSYLIPSGRDKQYLISLIAGALANLIINLILIPLIGVIGAIIGTIVAELFACFLQFFFVRKELPVFRYFLEMVPFLLFGLVMFFAIKLINTFLSNALASVFIDVLVGVVLYSSMSIIYLHFKHKDILFSKRKGT